MELLELPDAAAVASAAADLVAAAVAEDPELVLGLPTGRTPLLLYGELARRRAEEGLDLSRARAFNVDELVLPRHHPASFRAYMEREVWGPLGLSSDRCDIPDGAAPDLEAECRRYDAALEAAGGFGLVVLGIGADGHIAYNLPGQPVEATHVVALSDDLAELLAVPAEWWPLHAITVGLAPLRTARRVALLATTLSKAGAVAALLGGEPSADWPVTELMHHPDLHVLVSRDVLDSSLEGGSSGR